MLGEYFKLYTMASLHFLSISLFINSRGEIGQSSQFGDKGRSWTIPCSNLSRFEIFFLLHNVQTESGVLPVSYSMGTADFFPEEKAPRTWSLPLTSISCLP